MADFASFHDVLFPLSVSFGATGGLERRNEIVLMTSGRERRNARFSQSRRRYDAGTGVRSIEDLYDVLAFFEARRGSLHAFRFRDPFDMKSCRPGETVTAFDQQIGVGDGCKARFLLAKIYGVGADAYRRDILKPVAATVRVAVNNSERAPTTGFSLHRRGCVSGRRNSGCQCHHHGGLRIRCAGSVRHGAPRGQHDRVQGRTNPLHTADRGAAVSTYPEALAGHLSGQLTTLCHCWRPRLTGARPYSA